MPAIPRMGRNVLCDKWPDGLNAGFVLSISEAVEI